MFVRLKTYVDMREEAAAASSLVSLLSAERNRLQAEALAARKEVRRLTDVIIHLKDQGKVLSPGFDDPQWGRYVMGDDEEAKAGERAYQPPTAEEREASIDEAEFHKELADALESE